MDNKGAVLMIYKYRCTNCKEEERFPYKNSCWRCAKRCFHGKNSVLIKKRSMLHRMLTKICKVEIWEHISLKKYYGTLMNKLGH